jgi:hypothetical protein
MDNHCPQTQAHNGLLREHLTSKPMNANQIRRLIATGCHETFEADHLRGLSATINGADFPKWERDIYQEDIKLRIKRIEAIQNQKINDLIQNA